MSTYLPPTSPADAPRPSSMVKPLIIMVVLVALVIGGVFAWQVFIGSMTKKYMAGAATAPQTVSAITAAKAEWQEQIGAVGTLRAVRGADLSTQAAGVVDEILFESGNEVSAGKILLKLKPNDDYAKLDQLEAAAELAAQTLKRDQEQLTAQAISQQSVDSDVSSLKSARAQVAAQRALIEEKVLKAPFAGRLGIRQVDLGQYLAAGTTIVTLQALDPMLIDFYVPQQALVHLKTGQAATAAVDTYAGTSFKGLIESINSKIDPASRNVQVRASFPNADRRLMPGMFASITIDSGEARSELTIPQTAVTYNPYGDTVYVVEHAGNGADGNPKNVVQQRFVKLGATRGDQVAIASGIEEGDVIVTAGQMKLRNGTPVVINNTVQPTNDPNPTPPNE